MGEPVVKAVYPHLRIHTVYDETALLSTLRAGHCEAVIHNKMEVMMMLTHNQNCDLEIVGQPLFQRNAGWVTNRSSVCIQQALGYALRRMIDAGDIKHLEHR